jgi:3-oxoacyl-[acyl-carrier protein] reductase
MEKLLEGKHALITGGGRGIGRAIALEFAKNGANLAIAALEQDELDKTQKEIENFGVKCVSIQVDLSTLEGVKTCASQYFENFENCDILVANAAMSLYSSVVDYPLEKAQQLFNLNIMGYYGIVKLILPTMIEQGGGVIIMTSSIEGNVNFGPKKIPYAISKAGVTAMGKCLHTEVGNENIQVNVLMPASIQTRMIEENVKKGQYYPIKQMYSGYPGLITPEQVAPVYLFLASDLSKRRYKGKALNIWLLFELIPILKDKITGNDYEIKKLRNEMKDKLKKDMYDFFKKNEELVDFMLKYEI